MQSGVCEILVQYKEWNILSIKLLLTAIKKQVMKAYGWDQVQLQVFLTLAQEEVRGQLHVLAALPPEK
jgi:hypothetical protein